MKGILRRIVKFLAYVAACTVILLAIAVGLFRLFLPRVPEYQDEIKAWASTAIGVQVEFSGMDARWGLSGPELEFYDAELIRFENDTRIVAADEVRIGVGLMRLMFEQALVVDRLVISNTRVDVQQVDGKQFRIQGIDADELLASFPKGSGAPPDMEIIGEDIELHLDYPGTEQQHVFQIRNIGVSIDEMRIAADATVLLPEHLGQELRASATRVLGTAEQGQTWDVIVEGEEINLPGWSALVPGDRQLLSGAGDVEVALAYTGGRVTTAAIELDFADISLAADEPFDLTGRLEVDVADSDWLIAANELKIVMPDHEWPETSLRVEASVDDAGDVEMFDARSSYLNLQDLSLIRPWLNEEQRAQFDAVAPTGEIRELVATVSEIRTDEPRFDISADLDRVGIADSGRRPGVRGFSGMLRANRAGGRIEINSADLEVAAPEYLSNIIEIADAQGTVIWRNGNDSTTILSDSIMIDSEFFASRSNVQLVLHKDGSSPEIDLASTWSIPDVATAKRYIPRKGLKPKLYDWFQMALVSGSITRGTTTLNGPLDKFPFDGGEGRLLIDASVRNMTFKYHQDWPATEQSSMEVTLDNARLYTTENSSISAGIPVLNADVDIPDLRNPVLSIHSFSASSLDSIREFSLQSPIAKVFGGQLDRITASGEASFTLDLTVPLKKERVQEFEFTARVRSNNGTIAIEGFNPPVSDLIGEVTIEREHIASEGLGGRFLGQDVSISLARSEDPQFSVIATTTGSVSERGIIDDLGAPLEGFINGTTQYEARIQFPNSKVETPSPLTIAIETDLLGLEIDLPEPVGKSADDLLRVAGDLRFIPGGEQIESAGFAENRVAWELAFNRPEERWDFDRGVVTFGGDAMQQAETRGLHLRGATEVVRLQDWLSLPRRATGTIGVADRIRSVDLVVDDLYVVGQHLKAHHVRVDRSARDWLVQIQGDDVAGSVFVPYDFSGDRAMVLDMERLRLPGDEAVSDDTVMLDPRNLPAIQLTANEFAFGERYLGTVTATIEKTEDGLEAVSLTSIDESFGIEGSGRWVVDDQDELGSHSYVNATLTSTDVEATMARLNYQPGIVSNNMSMQFDVDWSGSPRGEFFSVLDGDVRVDFEDGSLVEVSPGAGRIFGLMSIVALPRRLSLDFRDVFSKGFSFDKIAGTFTIDDGSTYTCDLSLEGPAADIGIVGHADLANRTYAQTAIVSANVGNSLPIVGAVVAGPQVAAALLIFSQIFKKPLQEVGQVYYAIDGSWDEPTVESTNSAAFVASGELAGCLAEGE